MLQTLVGGCRCAQSFCDLDLIINLATITLNFNILSGQYHDILEVWEVDTWLGHCLEGVASWCDLDVAFDHVVVTLTVKILSSLYHRNHKVQEVDTWNGHRTGVQESSIMV